MTHYADSEVGRLQTVLLHRPGRELARLTPDNSGSLLFDDIPWVARAQEEHLAFAEALHTRGVEVLYLEELLADILAHTPARSELTEAVLADPRLGDTLRRRVRDHLSYLDPVGFAAVLTAGLARGELYPAGQARPPAAGHRGVVPTLLERHEFVVPPLPNLLFTRDTSVWIRDTAAVASFATPARRREATLVHALYRHHPRFAGTRLVYEPHLEHLEGGDVLLLAPGVLAVGVGERTTPAGAERVARRAFDAGLAHTVLVVPITQQRATIHLDTVCTMVDVDTVLTSPEAVDRLMAYPVTAGDPDDPAADPRIGRPEPLLTAAARAMGTDAWRVVDTGLDPVTAAREQWDDGNNTLAVAPRLCLAYDRNTETNAQLERAGIEVVRVPGSELTSGRGGPRCLSCPLVRDPTGDEREVSGG